MYLRLFYQFILPKDFRRHIQFSHIPRLRHKNLSKDWVMTKSRTYHSPFMLKRRSAEGRRWSFRSVWFTNDSQIVRPFSSKDRYILARMDRQQCEANSRSSRLTCFSNE